MALAAPLREARRAVGRSRTGYGAMGTEVRVGIENELRLKTKLREIRKLLVAEVANR